jgi:hypothetical protein
MRRQARMSLQPKERTRSCISDGKPVSLINAALRNGRRFETPYKLIYLAKSP